MHGDGPNVGSGTIYPVVSGPISNFSITPATGSWSITPAVVTAIAGSYGPLPYDANSHPLSACKILGTYTTGVTCNNALTPGGLTVASVGPGAGSGNVYPVVPGLGPNFSLASPVTLGSWSITKANLTLSIGGASQYSDPVTPSFQLSGFIGNDSQTNAGCTGSAATTATPGSAPGAYGVSSTLSCPNYTVGTAAGAYTVAKEDSTLTYTGLQDFIVPSTQTTVNVTLTYTLQDASVVLNPAASYYDANPGDITNAAAAPIVITGSYVASNGNLVSNYSNSCTPTVVAAAPGLTLSAPLLGINAVVASTGTFSCTVSLPVNGTFTATAAENTGSYYRFTSGDTIVALSTSNGGLGLLTGGGYQLASYLATSGNGTNGKYMDSSPVMLLPAIGTKLNFGFITKFNKNASNLQGNVNIIVRSKCLAAKIGGSTYGPVAGPDGLCVYQVKSTSQSSMGDQPATSTKPGYGNIVGNAIVNDVTWANSQPVMGGGTLTIEMYDNQSGNSGTVPDTLSIQIQDNKGNLWFSNNWNGGTLQTVATTGAPQIQGGNVTVH